MQYGIIIIRLKIYCLMQTVLCPYRVTFALTNDAEKVICWCFRSMFFQELFAQDAGLRKLTLVRKLPGFLQKFITCGYYWCSDYLLGCH